MAYKIIIKPSAKRELKKLARPVQLKISRVIDALAADPRPLKAQKLQGLKDLYRIRAGDYRIIYQVQARRLLVLVVRIGHRRDVYRGL